MQWLLRPGRAIFGAARASFVLRDFQIRHQSGGMQLYNITASCPCQSLTTADAAPAVAAAAPAAASAAAVAAAVPCCSCLSTGVRVLSERYRGMSRVQHHRRASGGHLWRSAVHHRCWCRCCFLLMTSNPCTWSWRLTAKKNETWLDLVLTSMHRNSRKTRLPLYGSMNNEDESIYIDRRARHEGIRRCQPTHVRSFVRCQ